MRVKYSDRLLALGIFVFFMLVVLNPYTKIGPLGTASVVLALSFYTLFSRFSLRIPFLIPFAILLLISMYGSFISYVYNIGQIGLLKVTFSTCLVMIAGHFISTFLIRRNWELDDLLMVLNLVVILNCVVVISEFIFPNFRVLVESILVSAGNRDWSDSFRYRGIASSGGASLSLLSAISTAVSLHLFDKCKISGIHLLIIMLILFTSVLLIGRTGLVLIMVVLCGWLFFEAGTKGIGFKNVALLTFSIAALSIFIVPFIKTVLTERYSLGMFNYALGFIFDGDSNELKAGGTIDTLVQYATNLPTELPYVLTGYGFYGSPVEFQKYTDSGFARIFLSVGLPLGLVYYLATSYIFRHLIADKNYRFLAVAILLILMIGELKEPTIFSGYGSRFLFLLCAFHYIESTRKVKLCRKKSYVELC